jgi:hypothetical protein
LTAFPHRFTVDSALMFIGADEHEMHPKAEVRDVI